MMCEADVMMLKDQSFAAIAPLALLFLAGSAGSAFVQQTPEKRRSDALWRKFITKT